MADYVKKERIKNALDHGKLKLMQVTPGFEEAKGRDRKTASLSVNVFANNPRITVWTGDPNDTGEANDYGKISANLTMLRFMELTLLIEMIADGPNDVKEKIENKNHTWYGGKRSDRPEIVSTTWIGKDADGVMFISVVAPQKKNRPLIKFVFGMDEYHNFAHKDGSSFSAAEFSPLAAKAWVIAMRGMVLNVAHDNYEAPPPRDQGGGGNSYGGGGGGGNRGNYGGGRTGGSGGGGGNSSGGAEMDSDIPF